MNCNEVQRLCDAYLDSELDAKSALEAEAHLKACPACQRVFNEEEKLSSQLKAGLNRGDKTAALWAEIEHKVAASGRSLISQGGARHSARAGGLRRAEDCAPYRGQGLLAALGEQLQAGWRHSRWAWSGLAAVWVAILALNLAAREPEAHLVARARVPSPSEVRLAWQQKQMMMADVAGLSEAAPAGKLKPAAPSPHSERRKPTSNA